MINIKDVLKIWRCELYNLFLQFRKNCAGVAALEFALVAPIMIVLYICSLEVSRAVSVNRKMSRIASTVGDLVTQVSSLDNNAIKDIMKVSGDVMKPYTDSVKIRVSGIKIQNDEGRIVWSCDENWNKLPVNDVFDVPVDIRRNGDFLVVSEAQTNYRPLVGINFYEPEILMHEKVFLRPRTAPEVTVTCP